MIANRGYFFIYNKISLPSVPRMFPLSDQELAALFKKHARTLLHCAYGRVHDYDDAEDLCHEAWLRFYENYHTGEKQIHTEPINVLFGILRHLIADYYHKKKQFRTALLILQEQYVYTAEQVRTFSALLQFENDVIACLFALSDQEKLAWLLRFDPQRTDWIAVLAGCSPAQIEELHRKSDSREIFIDEKSAAAVMKKSVFSYRRLYQKAQRQMNRLMRARGWSDFLERN